MKFSRSCDSQNSLHIVLRYTSSRHDDDSTSCLSSVVNLSTNRILRVRAIYDFFFFIYADVGEIADLLNERGDPLCALEARARTSGGQYTLYAAYGNNICNRSQNDTEKAFRKTMGSFFFCGINGLWRWEMCLRGPQTGREPCQRRDGMSLPSRRRPFPSSESAMTERTKKKSISNEMTFYGEKELQVWRTSQCYARKSTEDTCTRRFVASVSMRPSRVSTPITTPSAPLLLANSMSASMASISASEYRPRHTAVNSVKLGKG